MGGSSKQLLKRVAGRKRLASLAVWGYRFVLGAAVVYAVLLILSRLLGLIPDWYGPSSVAIIPGIAAIAALIFHRGASVEEAAHAVDETMGTKDLYLTAATIESAPGEFAPLVNQSVEGEAAKVQPAAVVPFSPWERLSHVVLVLSLLLVGARFLPQLDPFGQDEERKQLAERIKKLKEEKLIAEKRVEVLKSQDLEAKTSKPVTNAAEELKKTFAQMKKEEKAANKLKLNEQERKLGEQWKKSKEKSLQNTNRDQLAKRLGKQSEKTKQWKDDIQKGNADKMKKELDEIKELAEEMKNAKSETERKEKQKEMEQRIQEMNDFTKGNADSKELSESLNKALEQLAQSGDQKTAEEASEALKKQLEMSKKELERMAQSIRDQKELEKMLKTIQQAKQANDKEGLDGQQCESCQSMGDYQKLFEKLGGKGQGEGQGDGQEGDNGSSSSETDNAGNPKQGQGQAQSNKPGQGGTGGEGKGNGGVTPEDPTQKNTFKSEKAKSALQAGKTLLEWKTQEEAKASDGNIKRDFKNEVQKVKAGASEAILQEQIPPGYHDAIKKYFDSYEKKGAGKSSSKPAEKK